MKNDYMYIWCRYVYTVETITIQLNKNEFYSYYKKLKVNTFVSGNLPGHFCFSIVN